jgi:hypothetical protein
MATAWSGAAAVQAGAAVAAPFCGFPANGVAAYKTNREALLQWFGLINGVMGRAYGASAFRDICVQVEGTFGAAGSVSLLASDDGLNWEIAVDNAGNALTFTSRGRRVLGAGARYLKPSVTGGDATTNLLVTCTGYRR